MFLGFPTSFRISIDEESTAFVYPSHFVLEDAQFQDLAKLLKERAEVDFGQVPRDLAHKELHESFPAAVLTPTQVLSPDLLPGVTAATVRVEWSRHALGSGCAWSPHRQTQRSSESELGLPPPRHPSILVKGRRNRGFVILPRHHPRCSDRSGRKPATNQPPSLTLSPLTLTLILLLLFPKHSESQGSGVDYPANRKGKEKDKWKAFSIEIGIGRDNNGRNSFIPRTARKTSPLTLGTKMHIN